jgi:hypothetical protein
MDLDLAAMNLSELVVIAQNFAPEAHRGLSRELLISIIENHDNEVELPQRTINKKRLRIMRYVNDNWGQVEYQVSCPAKTRDPHACFVCTDVQTAECVLQNRKRFEEGPEE